MQKQLSIAVIGLGLIGGSIVKKLQNSCHSLIGVSRSRQTIDKALDQGLISRGSTDISIVKDADVVFICTPINKTVPMVFDISKTVKPETIITDAASLKGLIMDFVNTSHTPVNFIGGHPMAGTENKGLDSSFPELFEGAKWVLTPSKWVQKESINTLKQIIEELGAEWVIANPDEHDKAVALISHMPLLLSQSLFSLVENYPDQSIRELAKQLASSGFRDMTRLAATNPELAKDMLIENKTNVIKALRELVNKASHLEKQLSENEEEFSKDCAKIAEMREIMYSPEGKNVYDRDN